MQATMSALGVSWIAAVLLLAVRIAAALLLTPVLHAANMPVVMRVLFALALACVLALPFAAQVNVDLRDAGALAAAVLREAAIGATLGLGILMAFAGFALAGRLIDLQVGFAIAQVFDPATRSRLPVVSAVFNVLAVVFFFLVDGHHALLRGIAYSVERITVGQPWQMDAAAGPLLGQGGGLFALGFALAAPVVLGLMLIDFALGVIARNLPQMNMLALGIPVKIVAGLFALAACTMGFGVPAHRLYEGLYQAWSAWLTTAGGR